MKITSSYGVELRKQNIPIRQTLDIYRSAVGYLTEIYEQVWEDLERIPETKKRFNEAEHLIHTTKKNHPDKQLLLSEACIEYSKFSADDYLNNAQKYAHDMMGNLNEGMNTFLDWNLILNEKGGPNHVGNFCDAPYLFDRDSKELKESNILGYLWHFTHFLEPGAVRIGVSRYTDKLEVTALEKDDKITFVILNRTDEELTAHIRLGEYCTEITVQPKSIGSGVMTEWK